MFAAVAVISRSDVFRRETVLLSVHTLHYIHEYILLQLFFPNENIKLRFFEKILEMIEHQENAVVDLDADVQQATIRVGKSLKNTG